MTATIADGGGQAGVPYAGELYSSVLRLTRNPADAEGSGAGNAASWTSLLTLPAYERW